jgi:hypothetical protein
MPESGQKWRPVAMDITFRALMGETPGFHCSDSVTEGIYETNVLSLFLLVEYKLRQELFRPVSWCPAHDGD